MPTEVRATRSQVEAAKAIVERNSATGRPTPEAIRKIAEAEIVAERSSQQDRDTTGAEPGKGDLRISVNERDTDAESLWDWLRDDRDVRGELRLGQAPGPQEATGAPTEMIVDVTPSGAAVALVRSIQQWLSARPRADVTVKISGPKGEIVLRAEQAQDAERLLSNVLAEPTTF